MGKKSLTNSPILCDTNVLFRFMEGDEKTKEIIAKIGEERIAF